jgi:pSer/pThr/pTyr-binding forkhead associated (FHA) protein
MKDPGNPFPDRISIGRAPNCDIVIRENSVSKLHGHFREVSLEAAEFTDLRSVNGSRINGMMIAAGLPTIVRSLDEITLGRVHLKVMTAADLYRWL